MTLEVQSTRGASQWGCKCLGFVDCRFKVHFGYCAGGDPNKQVVSHYLSLFQINPQWIAHDNYDGDKVC